MIETTLAQTLGVAPPPLWTQLFKHVAGSEELQQFWGSRPICGQVPEVAGKPKQNWLAQFSSQYQKIFLQKRKVLTPGYDDG